MALLGEVMEKFGDKNKFAIWVDYYFITYKNDPVIELEPIRYGMGGRVHCWVNGKNIFAFRDCGPDATYGFDLNVLVQFFSEYLYYHITEDPFPVKTKATNGYDMMEEVQLVEGLDDDLTKLLYVDWDNVDMDLRNEIHYWNVRHGFLTNRGGSFLPDCYMRKHGNQIEFSWGNKYPHESEDGEFYFQHMQGLEYVDIKLYKEVVIAFCQDFLMKFDGKYPKILQEYKDNLQKAIDVNL